MRAVTSQNNLPIRLTEERWAHIIEEHAELGGFCEFLRFLPAVKRTPEAALWLTYDPEADVLYVNFKKPSVATDSALTDDDVIVRYQNDEIIGFTVLHASQRQIHRLV